MQLSRAQGDESPVAPVRTVHLGVGNFFRAHQAWYTNSAENRAKWGIAAFTGRSPRVADQLRAQDGLYTLRVQGRDVCSDFVVSSLSAVHSSGDVQAWSDYFRRLEVGVVTSTITEAGYALSANGGADFSNASLDADIAALRSAGPLARVVTGPGKLVAGLLSRRAALGADAPITFVPCDNIADNGLVLERMVGEIANAVQPGLGSWVRKNVSFVTTMVDRITPRATADDRARLHRETGVDDPALVITEPYSEWVLSGEFGNGRPAWESAGAEFVPDVRPFAERKLHLLNGAHSLMAYGGSLLGHETMADAMGDATVRRWVEEWWDLVIDRLGLPRPASRAYCASLVDRFANPRIEHRLAQTATDGSQKLAVRVVPVLRKELAHGLPRPAATRPVAAWICHLRGHGTAPVEDVQREVVVAMAEGDLATAVRSTLSFLGLGRDDVLAGQVRRRVEELSALVG